STAPRGEARPPPATASQQTLHDHDVEPLVELAPDLAFDAYVLEAARLVQGDARRVAADDAGERGVEAVVAAEAHELGEEHRPDPAPAVVAVHVHAVLDAARVRRAVAPRRQGREADD